MNARNDVNGIAAIIAANSLDLLAISEIPTTTIAVINVFKII